MTRGAEVEHVGEFQGFVRSWNAQAGWGFLRVADLDGEDIFVHHTAIAAEGYRQLVVGADVRVRVVRSHGRLKADRVIPMG